ncbi:MAG: LytTR family DNA-binding domain-containing protein [Bacteroidales bacterium]|nr:LytTR family DNA-binding domain-containing protein [Bacteroidales bacterium]
MEIRCIAIDDEPLALKKVASFSDRINGLTLVKTFDNALDAISFLKEEQVSLIFLDIQMEQFTGIQFLEAIKYHPQIIITTAYEQYALKGFEFNVTDYLLKPFSFDRFVQAVDRVMDNLMTGLNGKQEEENDFFFVKTEYRLEKIFFADILFIQGMSDYLQIVTRTRKIMTLQNFKFMERKLKPPRFVRVHKSFLVAVNYIESIERNRIKIFDQMIPISITYRDNFFKLIDDKLPPKCNPH